MVLKYKQDFAEKKGKGKSSQSPFHELRVGIMKDFCYKPWMEVAAFVEANISQGEIEVNLCWRIQFLMGLNVMQ